MPEQHLLPIALPWGRKGNRGYLTVYYAPRLKEPGVLNDYTEWMRWPDTLGTLTIRLGLSDGTNSAFAVPTPVGVTPDPLKWANTFRAKTPVKPHRFIDWSKTPLKTVATSDFSEAVLDLYARIAATYPTQPPAAAGLTSPWRGGGLSQQIDAAVSYLEPMEASDAGERLEEPRDPEWDFHEYVSLLGAHPELLRHLGLAADYEFKFPANLGKPTSVMVRTDYEWQYGASGAREVRMVMRTTDDFQAEPNPAAEYNEQAGGFLQLRKQDAFLSILDAYSTAGRLNGLEDSVAGGEAPLPALTTRALTLVRPDLLAAFRNRTERQRQIERATQEQLYRNGRPVEIFAEDGSIGHIIDVLHLAGSSGGTWRSLFERRADEQGYQFPHEPSLNVTPAPDEGWTQTLLATEIDERPPSIDLDTDCPVRPQALRRLDDQLYRWDGWSGAVRPPGGAIDGETGGLATTGPDVPDAGEWVQFAANYVSVPGTLPRLRFGETYQMRARCVDLAGNSVPLETTTPQDADTPSQTFGRLEPIAAPSVVRRTPRPAPGVGDDAVTVVLLSDYDVDDSAVEGQERLLFPGRVGSDLCALHGVPNGGADPASYPVLAERDARAPGDQWSVDPITGEPVAEGEPRQRVAYLSDPFIERLRAFHHGEGQEYLAELEGTWPDVASSRFEVVAGEGSTEVSPAADTELRFHVAKADIWSVDLSYAPLADEIHQFGLWHRFSGAEQDALKATIVRGSHWMFSARRAIRLIHAVRRPLAAPRVVSWSQAREPDSTGLRIGAVPNGEPPQMSTTIGIDRRSTGEITLNAQWTDLVDDLGLEAPAPRDGGAWLGRFTTPRDPDPGNGQYTIESHRAELGDTKRHSARIHVEAFSSFRSYFTEERPVTVIRGPIAVDERGFAGGTVTVRYGDDGTEARPGVDYLIDGVAGTLTATPGGALKLGSEISVRYVPLPVSRTSDEHPAFEVVFPNTATPPLPVVDSVIPAFARTRPDDRTISHDGRVVRLYLRRPWNSTGDGESLAVLVERSPGAVSSATRLGRDPILAAATPLGAVAVTQFTAAYATVVDFDGIHDLALHTVVYDGSSGRWFADIAVQTDAYRPFLQLVVARYQADSVDGKRLGPAVTLEPVRLGVARTVRVKPARDGYDIEVTGIEHGGIPTEDKDAPLAQNQVTLTLQEADPGITDADLRWLTDRETIALQRATGPDGTTWSGHMAVKPSGVPQRLVVEESEPGLFGGKEPTLVSQAVYTEILDVSDS